MSLAQGNNTPTRQRIEPGSPDPESDALTTNLELSNNLITKANCHVFLSQGCKSIYFINLFNFARQLLHIYVDCLSILTLAAEMYMVASCNYGFICLFVLMLYVPVNTYGHVGTSPPILWDFYPALR